MSHKEPMLYRAPADAGPPHLWDADHFIRLGTVPAVQVMLDEVFDDFVLEYRPGGDMAVGKGYFGETPVRVTLHLDPATREVMWIGLSNCIDDGLLPRLAQRFDVKAFDFESCEFVPF